MDLADPRGTRKVFGTVVASGDVDTLAQALIGTACETAAVGRGRFSRAHDEGAETVLLLDADRRDPADVAFFAVALITGAREAQREATDGWGTR
jgi:hypothetical protein